MSRQGINHLLHAELSDSMDVRFLVTFLEVVKTRHFAKTAENLYLTPSAVSARIKQLEEYFNTPLFVRHRNSIQLTAAGERLVPFAESLSLTLNDAVKAMNNIDVQHIAIAGTPNAWELYLHHVLENIAEQFPKLSVRADILTNEQLSRQLHERTLDMAIVSEPFKSEHIEMKPLAKVSMQLCWAKGDEGFENPEQASTKFINLEWSGIKVREEIEKHYPASKDPKFNTGSIRIAADYLLKQGGMAVLPSSTIAQFGHVDKFMNCDQVDPISSQLWLAYMKDVKHSGLAEIIDFVLEQANRGAASPDLRLIS